MSYNTFSTAIKTLLASALVVSAIGALTPGGAGAAIETPTQTSTASITPARQESVIATIPSLTPTTTTAPARALTINAETESQAELVAWALQRFEEAELELPPLTINIHSDRADCDGKNGYLAHATGGEFVIHSCGNQFTLLHELAHAWDMNSLDAEIRAEFLKLAQATTWNNNENWYLAGGEHAANVIAWGLVEDRINQTRTRPYDHNSMVKGFQILTGGEPLWMSA